MKTRSSGSSTRKKSPRKAAVKGKAKTQAETPQQATMKKKRAALRAKLKAGTAGPSTTSEAGTGTRRVSKKTTGSAGAPEAPVPRGSSRKNPAAAPTAAAPAADAPPATRKNNNARSATKNKDADDPPPPVAERAEAAPPPVDPPKKTKKSPKEANKAVEKSKEAWKAAIAQLDAIKMENDPGPAGKRVTTVVNAFRLGFVQLGAYVVSQKKLPTAKEESPEGEEADEYAQVLAEFGVKEPNKIGNWLREQKSKHRKNDCKTWSGPYTSLRKGLYEEYYNILTGLAIDVD